MSSGTGWIPSRRSIPASVILGSLPAQELLAGSFLPLPMAGVCGTPRPPPADHKVAVPDQCPPSPSARLQWVGEEPAGCAGFLLSHKGGGDAHQQPGPPLEALAVLGTPYMTHGGLTWGLYKTFGHISGGSVSAPGLSRAHPQHRGAAGCVDPCISLLLPVSPWRRGCVCGAGLTGSLLEELQQRGWVSLAALHSDVGAAGRNSEFLRGHSCHSCAGPCPLPAPPISRGCY